MVREALAKWFEEEGYSADKAATASEALMKLPRRRWGVGLVDIEMPDADGLMLQRKFHEIDPSLVIIMTGYASVETAFLAFKGGACDYIVKCFDPDDLVRAVRKAIEHRRIQGENVRLRERMEEAETAELVGRAIYNLSPPDSCPRSSFIVLP